MTDLTGFDLNELNSKAMGGSEITRKIIADNLAPELRKEFQIIYSRVRDIQQDKIRILYLHDLPQDPESARFADPMFVDQFHKFVFSSNWQYQMYQVYHNLRYNDSHVVIDNPIQIAPTSCFDKPTDKIRLVYTSTPQRGLNLLVPVFKYLAETHKDIHLDVFSSFKIYGWEERDKEFEPLYQEIREHPQMTYHGFVDNQVLRDHLNKSHIFAYPCIWLETSCRAMLESMSAGLVCVHPNYGALPETSGGLNIMYQGSEDPSVHANAFARYLASAINIIRENSHKNLIHFNKVYVDSRYNPDRIGKTWEGILNELLQRYPDASSRGQVFKIRMGK